MRYFSTASMKLTGSKPGSTTIEPPFTSSVVSTEAPAWLSGEQIRWRISRGHSHSASWMMVDVMMPRGVVMMPLGLPVVPPE